VLELRNDDERTALRNEVITVKRRRGIQAIDTGREPDRHVALQSFQARQQA
jgi:hypothetical protein